MKSNPINAKNFMEFFETEYGVKFVDSVTGENVLESFNKREATANVERTCGNCAFSARGDGISSHVDDNVCTSSDSPNVAEFIFANSCCDHWKHDANKKVESRGNI